MQNQFKHVVGIDISKKDFDVSFSVIGLQMKEWILNVLYFVWKIQDCIML